MVPLPSSQQLIRPMSSESMDFRLPLDRVIVELLKRVHEFQAEVEVLKKRKAGCTLFSHLSSRLRRITGSRRPGLRCLPAHRCLDRLLDLTFTLILWRMYAACTESAITTNQPQDIVLKDDERFMDWVSITLLTLEYAGATLEGRKLRMSPLPRFKNSGLVAMVLFTHNGHQLNPALLLGYSRQNFVPWPGPEKGSDLWVSFSTTQAIDHSRPPQMSSFAIKNGNCFTVSNKTN